MIKNDPQRKPFRRTIIFLCIWMPLMLAYVVFEYFIAPPGVRAQTLPLIIIILVSYLLIIVSVILVLILLRGTDKRRVFAIQGDQRFLAPEQPVPNETALALPASFQLRPKKGFFLLIAAGTVIAIIVMVVILPSITSGKHHLSLLAFAIIIGVMLLLMIIFFGVLLLMLRTRMRYQVDVDEQGITATYNKITTHMDWQAARFFTVNAAKKSRRPRMYELGNSDTIVRWIWVPCDVTFLYMLKPTVPCEEHAGQMQALLQLVEAKTHLPLYDISDPKARWYM